MNPSFSFLSRSERVAALGFVLALAPTLAVGFVPTSREAMEWVVAHWIQDVPQIAQMAGFPALALCFYLSLPRRAVCAQTHRSGLPKVATYSALPILISLASGFLHPEPGVLFHLEYLRWSRSNLFWSWLCIPVGEELLFRGWLFGLAHHWWSDRAWSAENPVRCACWVSSIGFSLWHLQNFWFDPPALVVLQLLYTLIAGIWLARIRTDTSTVLYPIAAHAVLNIASSLL